MMISQISMNQFRKFFYKTSDTSWQHRCFVYKVETGLEGPITKEEETVK